MRLLMLIHQLTAFAIAGIALDQAILPEAVVNLGVVPVTVCQSRTKEVPDSIAPFANS